MEKTIAILKAVMQAAGDMTVSEAIAWLEVKENAERLLNEGHTQPPRDAA